MKKLKITKRVIDKETRELLTPKTVIERSEKRAQEFLDRGVAVEIKEEKTEPEKESKPKKKAGSKNKSK